MSWHSWYSAWQGRRWARLEPRRFCRHTHLENWQELADTPAGLLLLLPKTGLWRAVARALCLFRQAETIEAAEVKAGGPTGLQNLETRLRAGATVLLLGGEAALREEATRLASRMAIKVCQVSGELRAGEFWVRVTPAPSS